MTLLVLNNWAQFFRVKTVPYLCLFYLSFTSLSAIFQSYRDGVWMWQGAQCSLLGCCLTEISRPRQPGIEPITSRSQSGRTTNWATVLVWKCFIWSYADHHWLSGYCLPVRLANRSWKDNLLSVLPLWSITD